MNFCVCEYSNLIFSLRIYHGKIENIMSINFRNVSENLVYIIFAFISGGIVSYYASTYSNKQTIQLLIPTIEQAIAKETTSILNEYQTNIGKQKIRKGSASIDYTPKVDNVIETNTEIITDTLNLKTPTKQEKPKRKKFLGIF